MAGGLLLDNHPVVTQGLFSLVVVPPGNPADTGSGANNGTDLANGQSIIIVDWKLCQERYNSRVVVHAAAKGTFNLDVFCALDTTQTPVFVGDQVASATKTVDGGAAGYTEVAELVVHLPYLWAVRLVNTSGGYIDWAYELREFCGDP